MNTVQENHRARSREYRRFYGKPYRRPKTRFEQLARVCIAQVKEYPALYDPTSLVDDNTVLGLLSLIDDSIGNYGRAQGNYHTLSIARHDLTVTQLRALSAQCMLTIFELR